MADEIIAMSRPEYLQRYGAKIQEKLRSMGFETVEDFAAFQERKRKEDQARLMLSLRRAGDKEDLLKVKEMGAGSSSKRATTKPVPPPNGVEAASPGQPGRAMPGGGLGVKPLSSFVKLDKFAQLDQKEIEELWTAYHSNKDCLSAVVRAGTFDKMMKNGEDWPMVSVSCRCDFDDLL